MANYDNDYDAIINPQYVDELAERRRLAALQFAQNTANSVDELINNAVKIDEWLTNGTVNDPKSPDVSNEISSLTE